MLTDDRTGTGGSTDDPLVSVIMPMYNAAAYASRSIEALTRQSYRVTEIIVVDDKSTDDTLEAARSAAASDPRVRIIALPENGGVAQARNAAVAAAHGDYVWFVDVDDEWDPRFIEIMVGAATTSGADLAVCSAVHRFGTRQEVEEFVVRYQEHRVLEGVDALESMLLGSGALWNKLFRREALGLDLFPPLPSKSDHGGVLRTIPRVGRIAVVPDVLYTYVQRDGSISNGGIAQPRNFLALLDMADDSLRSYTATARLRRVRARFRAMIVGRALRESWRYPGAAAEIMRQLPAKVRWRDLVLTVTSDRRTFVTCAAAKLSLPVAGRVFIALGRSRWTPMGTSAPGAR